MTQSSVRGAVAPSIPLVDLGAEYRSLQPAIDQAIARVLARGDFILGREVGVFETSFAALCGSGFAIGCGNGTDALVLALRAAGIGPGDEVIVPAMTFAATALAVALVGAVPVLVDVLADTALIDPDRIAEAITPRARALLPVHLFGQCADLAALTDLARRHQLILIEDAAQAHGATARNGRRAGASGAMGCFSFYPGKNLGAYGDAGMVVTDDPELADRLRQLRNLGATRKYHHERLGHNSRLDTIQAAVLGQKLPHLETWNEARRAHAARYDTAIEPLAGVERTRYDPGSVYHLYVVRVADRDRVLAGLHAAGIGAGVHYPFALHELEAFRGLGHGPGAFPVAEDWARRCLSLPIYPLLPEDAPARAASALAALLEGPST